MRGWKGKRQKMDMVGSDHREEMGEPKYIGSFLIFLFLLVRTKQKMLEVPKVEYICGTANVKHDMELGAGMI